MSETHTEIVHALRNLAEPTRLRSGSVIRIPAGAPDPTADPWHDGYLRSFDDRTAVTRGLAHLGERERTLLVLWYVTDTPVPEICRRLGLSRSHCYRLRDRALAEVARAGASIRAREPSWDDQATRRAEGCRVPTAGALRARG